jgi:hypothetical protein
VLLQGGQLLSAIGTASTTVAYPLLALAVMHSPARAGWVTFARIIPSLIVSLPGGIAADGMSRKKLMIVADGQRRRTDPARSSRRQHQRLAIRAAVHGPRPATPRTAQEGAALGGRSPDRAAAQAQIAWGDPRHSPYDPADYRPGRPRDRA